ncbi:cdkn1a interacting zinc finger protein 1a isoform X2 [Phyllopteryx taeniolatus]|uniref:cdkn1a interacting zinc finger protein 1a isoform X2 n=1 Tax=Phyllopteryx taeniolatus TaxID=161469 RepID=UPI002AD36127|nr:cdkn1a interacting zinc finger protein 1a isoform X2 [Phyllopteryx taeniolatus]
MFNPHTHQQQQQFHQHLRQLQQLFHQQPPPPPPPPPPPQPAPAHHVAHHHHQTPRAIPVPPHTAAPPPRMVNLCQATQTTIISPNPMLQGALMMQQMQGNMRGFGMAGQQFRQFFTATNRSLLGPVPIGMAMKSPLMGFPAAARPFHPHPRFYNNPALTTSAAGTSTATTSSVTATSTDAVVPQSDKKSDSEQMADGRTADIPAVNKDRTTEPDGVLEWVDGSAQSFEEQLEEPAVKRQRMEGSEEPKEDAVLNTANSDGDNLVSECNIEGSQLDDCLLEERGLTPSSGPAEGVEECHATLVGDGEPSDKQEAEGSAAEGVNKFYCYLCTITCHSQENFRSHMNSVSHQQRMMEIQHMSNACLVTLLPRLHETLQGTSKDGEKKADTQRWCATCCVHYSTSISDHRRTEEHKFASRAAVSSCSVCKKHFRSSKLFVAHLQSQEHRQRLEKLLDKDGFDLEEEKEEDDRRDPDEEDFPENQDGWSSGREVTLKDMASDEHYDPDTIYGSSFFVPVAGFICQLCNKFYHFDSSALHTHCKSLKHFDNLKKHKESLDENTGNNNRTSLTGTTTDSLEGDCPSSNADSVSKLSSTENQLQDNAEEPGTCQTSKAPAKLPADSTDLPASNDNTNEENNENALPKPNTRRRSGRAANRR